MIEQNCNNRLKDGGVLGPGILALIIKIKSKPKSGLDCIPARSEGTVITTGKSTNLAIRFIATAKVGYFWKFWAQVIHKMLITIISN